MKKKAIQWGADAVQNLYEKFGFFQRNPTRYMSKEKGREWLEKNKKDALEGKDKTLLLRAKETASLGTGLSDSTKPVQDMFLPTKVLKSMKGAAGEKRIRGESGFETLKKEIGDNFDIDQKGSKVQIGVNQNGEAFLLDGNTRAAVADKLNIPYLKTEVRYFNGGENAQGAFMPYDVIRMAKDRKGAQKSLEFEKEYGEYIKENMKDPNKKPYSHIGQLAREFVQFNRGGTTMKNNPPVGSLPEEVADDIPAMISEGEFVIPADVVRYVGLDKIHCMMRDAKMGLKAMEHEGLIVDVDEEGRPEEPQEEPKGEVAIIDVVQIEKAEPMVKELKEGGVVSPILNPEEEVNVMNQGGMLTQTTAPDGSLVEFQEGGMVDQMDAMMAEEMPQEAPDMAEEMPPAQTDPMADAPMLNAPLVQVINDVPHVLAYLQEDEIKALHSAGRGLDEEGKQQLSPEGVPVFISDASEASAAADAADAAAASEAADQAAADDAAGGVATADSPSAMGGPVGADDSAPGDMDDDSMKKMQEELTKEDKESLDPSGSDRIYKAGVGFIDKIINKRLQSQVNRPNPLQGMPQYNVATVAQGGLMRSPVYLQEGGAMMDDEDNRAIDPQDLPADAQNRMEAESRMPTQEEVPVASEPNIASDEQVAERLPDLFDSRTGERFDIFGMEGGNRAAQILGEDPDISDASLDYLRQNRDIFLNAKDRVESDEGVSYEDVAKEHFNLFGKDEDRIGAEGLMSMQQDQPEESVGDAVGDIAGGIMSPDTPAPTTEQQGFFTEDEKDRFVEQLGNIDMTGFEDVQKKMVADTFIEREDGSFDLDPRSIVASHLENKSFETADGKPATPDQAFYREGEKQGQPLPRQFKLNLMEAGINNLSNQYVGAE